MKAFACVPVLVALALLCLPAPSIARPHPTPTPSPTPVPAAAPAVTAIARREFVAWQIGIINSKNYDTALAKNVTDEKLKSVSQGLSQLGALTGIEYLGPLSISDAPAGMNVHGYLYHMICSEGAVYLRLILRDPDNKVAGILFRDSLTDEGDTGTPLPMTPLPSPPA